MKEAKITPAFAQTVGIAVDHRRHNKNALTLAANVKRLNDYKSKLILFPRVENKPKKGEIADSTADKLKAEPSKESFENLFSVPEVKKRCKVQAITKEMRDAKIYQTLRKARLNKRDEGVRQKKAAEAARQQTGNKE